MHQSATEALRDNFTGKRWGKRGKPPASGVAGGRSNRSECASLAIVMGRTGGAAEVVRTAQAARPKQLPAERRS